MKSLGRLLVEVLMLAFIAFVIGGMCATIISAQQCSHDYTVCNHHG